GLHHASTASVLHPTSFHTYPSGLTSQVLGSRRGGQGVLHPGAADTELIAVVDLGSDRMLDEEHVDPLDRDRLHLLDVAPQRLLIRDGVPNVEPTERSITDRVGEAECELVVAVPPSCFTTITGGAAPALDSFLLRWSLTWRPSFRTRSWCTHFAASGCPSRIRLIASSSCEWAWSWNAGTSPSCSGWMRGIAGCTYRTRDLRR